MWNIKMSVTQSMSQRSVHSPWERRSVQIHNNVVKIQISLNEVLTLQKYKYWLL